MAQTVRLSDLVDRANASTASNCAGTAGGVIAYFKEREKSKRVKKQLYSPVALRAACRSVMADAPEGMGNHSRIVLKRFRGADTDSQLTSLGRFHFVHWAGHL